LKPLLAHPGIGELLALHRACGIDVDYCERVLRETPPEALNPRPLVTGDDLRDAGLKPGPDFKRLLDAVREAQLDATVTTKEEALALAKELRGPAP
jgi:poly(A) polymerase